MKINSQTQTPIELLDLSEEESSWLKLNNFNLIEDIIDNESNLDIPENIIEQLKERKCYTKKSN